MAVARVERSAEVAGRSWEEIVSSESGDSDTDLTSGDTGRS